MTSKKYEIELTPGAKKQLKAVHKKEVARLLAAIEKLRTDPYPVSSKKLKGRDAFRVRVGVYRIIYEVHDDILLIFVVALGHRRDVYEK